MSILQGRPQFKGVGNLMIKHVTNVLVRKQKTSYEKNVCSGRSEYNSHIQTKKAKFLNSLKECIKIDHIWNIDITKEVNVTI